jgi:hypothetical protein
MHAPQHTPLETQDTPFQSPYYRVIVDAIKASSGSSNYEATGPSRGQASTLICASPWIDSLAHTVQDAIPRYKGHNLYYIE